MAPPMFGHGDAQTLRSEATRSYRSIAPRHQEQWLGHFGGRCGALLETLQVSHRIPGRQAEQVALAVFHESHPLGLTRGAEHAILVGKYLVRLGVDFHSGVSKLSDLAAHVVHPKIEKRTRRPSLEQETSAAQREEHQARRIETSQGFCVEKARIEVGCPVEVVSVLSDLMKLQTRFLQRCVASDPGPASSPRCARQRWQTSNVGSQPGKRCPPGLDRRSWAIAEILLRIVRDRNS